MKPSFLLFIAFAISFVTTIAFTDPEILSFNSDYTTSGSDLDSIPKSFDVPREKMSKRVQPAPSLDISGWGKFKASEDRLAKRKNRCSEFLDNMVWLLC